MSLHMMGEVDVMRKLDAIQNDIKELKKRVVDADTLLTEDDIQALDEAEKDLAQARTKRIA